MAYKKAMIYLSSKDYSPKLHETYTIHHDGKEYPSPGAYNYSLFDWYHGDFSYYDDGIESRKKNISIQSLEGLHICLET